jgi:signal transduction histidine kinase
MALGRSTLRKLVLSGSSAAALTLLKVALAQQPQFGTAAEARTLLERAIPLVKTDKAAAFAKFLSGADGFKFVDLYVFCFNSTDGRINVGTPEEIGKDARTFVDKEGIRFGEKMLNQAREGKIIEVGYMFPRPGSDVLVPKVSFVTKVADQICGVGYYP